MLNAMRRLNPEWETLERTTAQEAVGDWMRGRTSWGCWFEDCSGGKGSD
jgi:hypothetical protein